MTLQSEILNRMEQITPDEKNMIAAFLQRTYAQNPSKQVNLEVRAVKVAKCVNEGAFSTIAVPSSRIESAKDWLKSEGFTVVTGYRPSGNFWGYKVFLIDNYAPL